MGKRPGIIFIVSAPSGGGKTSIVQALLKTVPGLSVAISHTTRPSRDNEKDGQSYHFVSSECFADMVKNGEFVEHATVFSNQYGTSVREIEERLACGEDVLLDIDWQGAEQVQQVFPQSAVSIFLLPPSSDELERRLKMRGQDAPEVIEHRMSRAKSEMSHYSAYHYLVINDNFDKAVSQLAAVIKAERCKTDRQGAFYAELLADLLHLS